LRSGSAHWDLELVVVPTGIWSSRLRPGSAHCDLEVPVEVRHWDLDCEEEAAGEEAEEAEEEKSSVKI